MTRQVSLSEVAYWALRAEKDEAESFSQVVLRLLQTARRARKDPLGFAGRPRRHILSVSEHLALIEADRDRDRAE